MSVDGSANPSLNGRFCCRASFYRYCTMTYPHLRSQVAPFACPPGHPPIHSPRRLRHYLIGTPDDTQHAIDRLHLLGYLERISWSHAIDIPENGLIIRPDSGDVLRYSQRDRPNS
jgi:hypothetical protein